MRALGYLFALVVLLLIGSVASTEETPKGFLGIELKGITKEDPRHSAGSGGTAWDQDCRAARGQPHACDDAGT